MKISNLRLCLIAIAALIGLCPTAATAQNAVGEWNIYPTFDGTITRLLDTKNKVYYTSANRLYSYDKTSNESYNYGTNNLLNDTQVSGIFYNYEEGFLAVAYATGNIDLIYDKNSNVVNMSDIKDAVLTRTKGINDIAFSEGKMYVATDFGLVIFDTKKHQVIESGVYPNKVENVLFSSDHIFIFSNDNLYIAPASGRHNTIDKFTATGLSLYNDNLIALDGGIILENNKYLKDVRLLAFNLSTLSLASGKQLYVGSPTSMGRTADGNVFVVTESSYSNTGGTWTSTTDKKIAFIGKDGEVTRSVILPYALLNNAIGLYNDEKSLWAGNNEGIGNYSVSEDGGLTVLSDKARPEGSPVSKVAFLNRSADGSTIMASNLGYTVRRTTSSSIVSGGYGQDIPSSVAKIVNGKVSDASCYEATERLTAYQKQFNNKRIYGSAERLAIDPQNPNRYFVATYTDGLFVVENGKEVAHLGTKNMPTYTHWDGGGTKNVACLFDVRFDPEGNLWVGAWCLKKWGSYAPYTMLPKAKLYGTADLNTLTPDDWQKSAAVGLNGSDMDVGEIDLFSVFSSKSNIMVSRHRGMDRGMIGVTNLGKSRGDTSDDYYKEFTYRDQDGNSTPVQWLCMTEDNNGAIWLGSDQGVYYISDPSKLFDADFRITRAKVPRNDGTNFADYLLESETINDIAVDASNRKWIATENSGVYLVSENGDKILAHYTMDNSMLPSNSVYAAMCDLNSNKVYFGGEYGLYSFNSTSSPAASDYSDVYAYPNPVRPEYTGWVTIKGLMDNSLVKIADAAGNVIFQTRSDGGMAIWDACDATGQRVKSGVYFVFASQTDGDSTTGAVTKIMVVN